MEGCVSGTGVTLLFSGFRATPTDWATSRWEWESGNPAYRRVSTLYSSDADNALAISVANGWVLAQSCKLRL